MASSLVKGKLLLVTLVLLSFSAAGSLDLEPDWVTSGDGLVVTVNNSSMNNDSNAVESFSVDIESDSEQNEAVEVVETGEDTGIFTGSITAVSSDSDSALLVSHGDAITASYNDGQAESQDSSEADLELPELVSAVTTSSRTVNVTLDESGSGLDKGSINASDFEFTDIDNSVDSVDKSNVQDGDTGAQTLILNLNGSMGTGETPGINIRSKFGGITDKAGNIQDDHIKAEDGAHPVVLSASAEDGDIDGDLDRITLIMTEDIMDYISLEDAFDVKDSDGSSIEVLSAASGGASTEGGLRSSSNTVVAELEEGSSTGQPSIEYEAVAGKEIVDREGNVLESSSPTVTDNANPVLLHAVVDKEKSDSSETYVKLNFSEPVEDLNQDSRGVDVGDKSIDFYGEGLSKVHSVNYGSVLETGNSPEVSFNDEVKDQVGNSVQSYESGSVEVDTFRKELAEGWNFISFPIEHSEGYPVTDIFQESNIESVWTYQGGEWLNYDPDIENNDFTDIKGGYGYLVKSKENYTLAPNINNTKSGDSSNASYELQEGWNLVGHFQEYNQSADTSGAFNSLDSGSIQSLEIQDSEGQLSTTTMSEDFLEPGEAYWLEYGSQDDYMTSNAFSQPSQSPSLLKSVIEFVEEWFK